MNDLSAVVGEKMPWTDDRVETLKKLWADGLSASQIAGKLGMGVTRNAVIGKVHRLNLAGRVNTPRAQTPRTARKPSEGVASSAPRGPSRPIHATNGGRNGTQELCPAAVQSASATFAGAKAAASGGVFEGRSYHHPASLGQDLQMADR